MTDADRFKIDLEQLDDAITVMEKFGTAVTEWLGEVDRHVADLHLDWEGAAATAQRISHDKWVTGVEEMNENLHELREVARVAHTNYSGAISHNTRMWPA